MQYPHGISDRKEELHQTLENVMQLAMKGEDLVIYGGTV